MGSYHSYGVIKLQISDSFNFRKLCLNLLAIVPAYMVHPLLFNKQMIYPGTLGPILNTYIIHYFIVKINSSTLRIQLPDNSGGSSFYRNTAEPFTYRANKDEPDALLAITSFATSVFSINLTVIRT